LSGRATPGSYTAINVSQLNQEGAMNKNQKPGREIIISILENTLRFVKGGEEKQHVDNPGQTPMRDGPS
jgi:hypothetical protein